MRMTKVKGRLSTGNTTVAATNKKPKGARKPTRVEPPKKPRRI